MPDEISELLAELGKAKPTKESQNEKANYRVNLPGRDVLADPLVCERSGMVGSQIDEIQSPETKSGASVSGCPDDLLSVANPARSLGEPLGMGGGEAERVKELPTSEQNKRKVRKKRDLRNLPTSEQAECKSLLPTLPSGFWWECPSDDKGVKIKLRWRGGQPPNSHVFKRVGKNELQTWKELNSYDQKWTIADRIRGELINKGKRQLAARIGFIVDNDQQSI